MTQSPDTLVSTLLEFSDDDADVNRMISGLPDRGVFLGMQPDCGDPVWYTHFDCWNDGDDADDGMEWDIGGPEARANVATLMEMAVQLTDDRRFTALNDYWREVETTAGGYGDFFNKVADLFIQNGYDVYISENMVEVYVHDEIGRAHV